MSFRQLSPWDSIQWFDVPRENYLQPAGGTIQAAPAEIRRVLLMFSLGRGGFNVGLTTRANVDANVVGFDLNVNNSPVVISHSTHGPLVQQEWFVGGPGGSDIVVIEVLLRDWPEDIGK